MSVVLLTGRKHSKSASCHYYHHPKSYPTDASPAQGLPVTGHTVHVFRALVDSHGKQALSAGLGHRLSANQHVAPLESSPLGLWTQVSFQIPAYNFLQQAERILACTSLSISVPLPSSLLYFGPGTCPQHVNSSGK